MREGMRSVIKQRGGAIFAVLVLTLGHVGSLAHALTQEHDTCAEHGELIEVAGSSHAKTSILAEKSDDFSPLLAADDVAADGEEHAHDHCVLAVHVSPLGTDDLSVWTGTVLRISKLSAPVPELVLVARPVLSIAPKQSPPAFV